MDNYTGPFWSNGRLQSSVEFGDSVPLDPVDFESRLHDSAFAHFGDARHRAAADWIYKENLSKVSSLKSSVVRNLPFYGNLLSAGHVSGLFSPLSPVIVADAILRGYRHSQRFRAGEYKKEIADVLKFYKEDPYNMGNVLAPAIYPEAFSGKPSTSNQWLRGSKVQPGSVPPETAPPPITAVDDSSPNEVSPDINGNIAPPPVTAAPPTVSVPDVVQAVSNLGKENLEILTGERGQMMSMSYAPYRPLKRKRRRITQRMVTVFNREHGTSHTLAEVQAITGGYF